MSAPPSLLPRWSEENNTIIQRWKDDEKRRPPLQDVAKRCYSECLKLYEKIGGVPAGPAWLQLDITVAYNTLLFSLRYSNTKETKHQLTYSLLRALEAVGVEVTASDLDTIWQIVLQTFTGTQYDVWIHKLLLIQWAIWLSECHYEGILRLLRQTNSKKVILPSEDLLAETRNLAPSVAEDASLLDAVPAKDLKALLLICTFVSKGLEQMRKGDYTEALVTLQEAATLPSPRALLAYVHSLKGRSFAKLGQLHTALQCYQEALEVDFSCQMALYQSSLVYRLLSNAQAEIEALQLLYSASLLHKDQDSLGASVSLLSPDVLLSSEQMSFITQIPSRLVILHTLGCRYMQNDRKSEGAECYLDLLASLQSGPKQHFLTEEGPTLPRVPVIYLEAAFSMLKAKRFWDSIAVCDELVAKTVDLIPERLLIDPFTAERHFSGPTQLAVMNLEPEATEDKLECVLWSGAAHFLLAQAYLQLENTKEALTNFTRAVNVVMKVRVKQNDRTVKDSRPAEASEDNLSILEALKGRVLAGRGLCFVERGQLKEALRDFQLSLQAFPGCRTTKMWLVEILWRLNRNQEAAALWRQTDNSTQSPTSGDLSLYLQMWQEDAMYFCPSGLDERMEEFIRNCDVAC